MPYKKVTNAEREIKTRIFNKFVTEMAVLNWR